MRKALVQILLLALAAASSPAGTPLTVGQASYGVGGPCWDDVLPVPNPPAVSGTFALPGVSGSGVISSSVVVLVNNLHGQQHLLYNYSLDLSPMPAANHCIKLLVHFGTPRTCAYDVLVSTGPGVAVSSATKAAFGDITLWFGGGCLSPSLTAAPFGMISDTPPKTNVVTVIDDYVDPASGQTNEARVNVTAVVPDIPPNWAYAPQPLPNTFFQGFINYYTNSVPMKTNLNGAYDFTVQLVAAASNGLPVGPISTQTVQVVNGLFNMPLPSDLGGFCDGSAHWLSLAVKPSGLPAVQFNPLNPPLPLSPTPQALYAYSAGVVADLVPGQAVTSLNGLTDAVYLQPGNGIVFGTNGSSLTISAQPGVPSDQNIKTDFTRVKPEDILAKLVALPVPGWRYTNEVAGVRHIGPMAQEFKATFGLGQDDRFIAFVDEEGVALAAIQGLNQKVDAENATLRDENAELRQQLGELKQLVNHLNQKINGGAK